MILDNAPSRSAELLAQSRVDAALVPVIAFQLIENVRLVPNVCVGARERVQSVCLVTKGLDLSDVKSVSLDISSKTSVALTKIIFREFLNIEPIWTDAKPNLTDMLKDSDCALLIGDPALSIADSTNTRNTGHRTQDTQILRKFDLAETWREFTGLGFVFAMFMANVGKIEVAKTIDFAAARDEGLNHLDEIISNYESQISLSREEFYKYLSENISYTIDNSMQKGLELYFELAHKHNLINNCKPLRFI